MVKIFDINEGHIVVNENCLLIPELKRIMEEYEDPIPVLSYVHFSAHPQSPYKNLPDSVREETILDAYPGDYSPEDEAVYKAIETITRLYDSPRMRLHRNAKKALETLSDYLGKAMIRDDDKSGNFSTFQNALKNIARISKEFDDLDKQVEEELRVRGQGTVGYDEL